MFGGWCDSFFCIRDIRRAVVAIGIFSMITSIAQILVTVAVLTGANAIKEIKFQPSNKEVGVYEHYIFMAALDFVLAIFSLVLLYGNERTDEVKARFHILPWLLMIPVYVILETALNIGYFYYNLQDVAHYDGLLKDAWEFGFTLTPLIYFIVKEIILIIAFIVLTARYQSLRPHKIKYKRHVDHRVSYVEHEQGISPYDCYGAPTMIPAPAAYECSPAHQTTCYTGGCDATRCPKCNRLKPIYG